MDVKPKDIEHYEACTWRGDDMSFLDFCRNSNNKGEIHQWVRKLYEASEHQ